MDARIRGEKKATNFRAVKARKKVPAKPQRAAASPVSAEQLEKARAKIRDQLNRVFEAVAEDCAAELASSGKDVDDLGGPDAVADAVRAVLPRVNRFVDRAGPVYTTGQLQVLLPGLKARKIGDQAVRNRLDKRRLIGAKTSDKRWVFPAYQFQVRPGRLVVREDVLELWNELPVGSDTFDDWTLLAWMSGPRTDLDGNSPLQWLDDHGLDQRLKRAAGRVRARAAA